MYKANTCILFSLFLILLQPNYSCSKKYEEAETIKEEMGTNLRSETWIITNYVRNANDKTNEWNNISFVFKEKDIVKVVTDSNVYSGWWRFIIVNEEYDSGTYDFINFNLGFNTKKSKIDSLNKNWNINDFSFNKLELIYALADTSLVDKLTFERN